MNLFKYLKSVIFVFLLVSFFTVAPKVFAITDSVIIHDPQSTAEVHVIGEITPISYSTGSTVGIWGTMTLDGPPLTSNTSVTMSVTINGVTSIIISPTILSVKENSSFPSFVNGYNTITAPAYPNTYTAHFVVSAFGGVPQTFDIPITVTQNNNIAVSVKTTPNQINSGGSTLVQWNSAGATSCTSSAGGGTGTSGSITKNNITLNTTYTVTCTGLSGSATDSDAVSVMAITSSFTANPTQVSPGGTSKLSWNSSGANTCYMSGGGVSGGGTSYSDFPTGSISSDTTYTLSCQRDAGAVPPSCFGDYLYTTGNCSGTVSGSRCTDGSQPFEGENCGQFSSENMCPDSTNPWCQHGCHWVPNAIVTTCVGLSQTLCGTHPTCTWNAGGTIPGDTNTKNLTVTTGVPSISVTLKDNFGVQGPWEVSVLESKGLVVDGANITSCDIFNPDGTKRFSNIPSSQFPYSFSTDTYNTPGTYPYDVVCIGPGGTASVVSPLSDVLVTTQLPSYPDLTASAITPTFAVATVPKVFYSVITNASDAGTVDTFTNIFQTATGFDDAENPINLQTFPTAPMPPISGGGTGSTGKTITFSSVGTHFMRVCADKSGKLRPLAPSCGQGARGWVDEIGFMSIKQQPQFQS